MARISRRSMSTSQGHCRRIVSMDFSSISLHSLRVYLRCFSMSSGPPDACLARCVANMKFLSSLSPAILSSIAIAIHTSPQKPLRWAPNTLPVMSSLPSHREVPGDSPACYVGDPSNDLLSIEALDLSQLHQSSMSDP